MREIRFRAWDKKGKGFINGFNMIGFCTGQGAPKRKLQRYDNEWDIDDVILEQYTGLKDRTAEEICKGDIIKCLMRMDAINHDDESAKRYEVREVENGCPCSVFQSGIISIGGVAQVEIIGNIHTTPELLEAN